MRYSLHRTTSRYRPRIVYALLVALASASLAAHATDPTAALSHGQESASVDEGLLERCSSAGLPNQSVIGGAHDNVATQLRATIKRTEAPELREKLIGAYRRYLGCPAGPEPPRRPDER